MDYNRGCYVGVDSVGDGGVPLNSELMRNLKWFRKPGLPLPPWLVGWYKVDEGSGLIVKNYAVDGSLGGGLLGNLAVRVIGGQFWTFLPGFGSTVGPSDSQSDHAYLNLGTTRSFGGLVNGYACYGMFYKRKATATTTGGISCSLYQTNTNNPGAGTEFVEAGTGAQKIQFGWRAAVVGYDYNPTGVWVFLFVDNSGRLAIVKEDGTKIVTAINNINAAILLQYLHLGCRYSFSEVDPYGYYPCQGSYGDWIIYNNIMLTDSQWGFVYDLLKDRYGMAARSGW